MPAEGLELGRGPAPVLEHLAGRLDEVADRVGPVEAGVGRPRHQVVDAVAQLVEERHDLVVLEETGLLGRWLGEVAHQRGGGVPSLAVDIDEALSKSVLPY